MPEAGDLGFPIVGGACFPISLPLEVIPDHCSSSGNLLSLISLSSSCLLLSGLIK